MKVAPTYLGTAGWSLPRAVQESFPAPGSHLVRYATRFSAAEINSSFYRSHRPSTYERWADAVPSSFRFSVKVPKTITHEKALAGARDDIENFLIELAPLGEKLGCLLVQLPPKLELNARAANAFFTLLRDRYAGPVVAEPRHASWFTAKGDALLARHQVARVAADPARVPEAARPAGWPRVVYYRLHGAPRMYYSSYDRDYLAELATHLEAARRETDAVWCIFDNTASGAAAANALEMTELLSAGA
ncbi:MAG: hypothetical protein JWM41_1095 [Gemmatimonadetes bacterium]|nr:hypothetical protein [Gemmatimonadota bacterium]